MGLRDQGGPHLPHQMTQMTRGSFLQILDRATEETPCIVMLGPQNTQFTSHPTQEISSQRHLAFLTTNRRLLFPPITIQTIFSTAVAIRILWRQIPGIVTRIRVCRTLLIHTLQIPNTTTQFKALPQPLLWIHIRVALQLQLVLTTRLWVTIFRIFKMKTQCHCQAILPHRWHRVLTRKTLSLTHSKILHNKARYQLEIDSHPQIFHVIAAQRHSRDNTN
jgi:hypothetical protein